jgi:guanylate kinase
MSTTTPTQRTAAAKKAAATRRANARRRSASAKRAAATRELNQRTPIQQAQEYAEKALLIPVGAALVARDSLVEATKPYVSPDTAQTRLERDLRRFERRGSTARSRVERRLRKARTRVERELRARRNRVQRTVRRNRTVVEREVRRNRRRVEREAKNLRAQFGFVGSRVDEAVANGQKAVADGVERVTNTV